MAIARDLGKAGLLIARVDDGQELLAAAELAPPQAVLFDADLPDMAPQELLRQLRHRAPNLPVCVLLPEATPEASAAWIARGADHVITAARRTPPDLEARLRALVCRAAGFSTRAIETGTLRLDCATRTLHVAGTPMQMTRREYEIFETLALNPNSVIDKETLMTHLYGWGDAPDTKIIDVYMCRIRRKITALGGDDSPLETHFGRGYRLRVPQHEVRAA